MILNFKEKYFFGFLKLKKIIFNLFVLEIKENVFFKKKKEFKESEILALKC